jgi:hypothetical protein
MNRPFHFFLAITLAVFSLIFINTSRASSDAIFPIELSYDTGISHVYRFQPSGHYTLILEPNEAHGYEGGSGSGTYTFKPNSKGEGTISLKEGGQIKFSLAEKLLPGKSIEATGMVYDQNGSPRYPEDMPILIQKLK